MGCSEQELIAANVFIYAKENRPDYPERFAKKIGRII
jgi:hypothetical protein